MDNTFGKPLATCERLGLSSGNNLWPYQPPGIYFLYTVSPCHKEMLAARMVGGDFLIVNLSERHLRKPKSPDELVEYCQFRVLADEAHAEYAMCMRSTYLLSSSVLRCGHICADSSWSEAALGWLHDIELAELYKIEPNMRPPVVNAALRASLAPKKHWLDRAKAFVTR
ncbi:hypothetical protein H112_08770 [Trichophyton rubrum D6]|nr:hypothetical protein H100_08791 [Trichophyton rubrum MR850]EZF36751.1 hypothetical protein H102_08751 [Trichophyton rubrum CBS 100081]EZF47498.1 hypothetical protein H103_08773 [Trichophyton rubrum CBS 288.86]EZF58157.1 hypothetical protein H104_08726 [Trichophyton rubrum CBS 289.86]EZF68762.1 hypothetical protein H105_08776 [Trichophyton soudanense CBS 452.61]EZF79321.1 hypothetical protein H110_08775 [Trichophyton rubrum MR1448]EZF90214.1 hypothetical protein H113_08843 [Trichophyton rub